MTFSNHIHIQEIHDTCEYAQVRTANRFWYFEKEEEESDIIPDEKTDVSMLDNMKLEMQKDERKVKERRSYSSREKSKQKPVSILESFKITNRFEVFEQYGEDEINEILTPKSEIVKTPSEITKITREIVKATSAKKKCRKCGY